MLLFRDDLKKRQHVEALFLRAEGNLGLGNVAEAELLLRKVLALDRNHAGAVDLLAEMDSNLLSAGAC